jgi:hypothetical protein
MVAWALMLGPTQKPPGTHWVSPSMHCRTSCKRQQSSSLRPEAPGSGPQLRQHLRRRPACLGAPMPALRSLACVQLSVQANSGHLAPALGGCAEGCPCCKQASSSKPQASRRSQTPFPLGVGGWESRSCPGNRTWLCSRYIRRVQPPACLPALLSGHSPLCTGRLSATALPGCASRAAAACAGVAAGTSFSKTAGGQVVDSCCDGGHTGAALTAAHAGFMARCC